MTSLARLVSWIALAGTLLPPLLFFAGLLDLASMKTGMLVATIAWFAATPFWMDSA
jgi:hypothetical protein